MTFLVVGGAGYIGSHMIKLLGEAGHRIVCFDNLSAGYRDAVSFGEFVRGDLNVPDDLNKVFEQFEIEAVFDFAAKISVGESIKKPFDYYLNNVVGTLNLLRAMQERNIKKFIFSSTAAVYGVPKTDLIDENHPLKPINSYGWSKYMVEKILADCFPAYRISSVCFRYFNAAGAAESGNLGERHEPETHLIPLAIRSALKNDGSKLKIFGDNYPTADGTCVRDYIHVDDLCSAHFLGLEYLKNHPGAHIFNLGNGQGFSVKEVVRVVEKVAHGKVLYEIRDRRPGDPPVLVADSSRARSVLGWNPKYKDLEKIVATAWQFHAKGN